MATYNRAHLLPRAIESVLHQRYKEWELIIVDDGSTDETSRILQNYNDPRIKIITLNANRGVIHAKNTGLDNIDGEWFTFLDSDDEIIPDALSILMAVADNDPTINAITCNCIDSQTGRFTGFGLNSDQYVEFSKYLLDLKGEHWGITKHDLLGELRFNPRIETECILWTKISQYAKRYYVHKGLRIYHVEGCDRLCDPNPSKQLIRKYAIYGQLITERNYLNLIKRWNRRLFFVQSFYMLVFQIINNNDLLAKSIFREIIECTSIFASLPFFVMLVLGPFWTKFIFEISEKYIKPWFLSIINSITNQPTGDRKDVR